MKRSHDYSLDKVPPQNIEAEEAIISSILIDNDILDDIVDLLAPQDFYRTAHKEIYRAIQDLYSDNQPVDLITLANRLEEKDKLKNIGGASFLARIIDTAPFAVNAKHYAKIIEEKAFRRNIIRRSNKIVERCFKDGGSIDEVMDFVEHAIFDELNKKNRTQYFALNKIIDESIRRLEKQEKTLFSGIPSGFKRLDNLTSGFQNSDLIIIAARPSMGKTAFALNIARNAAIDANVPVALFSFEMSKEQLCLRMLCSEAKVSSTRLRGGFLTKNDWIRLTKAAEVLSGAPIFIDDSTDMTALDVRAKSRRMKMKENLGLVIIDYLQLMEFRDPDARKPERRDLEIAQISRSMKNLAKELDVPVVALSQLNRMLEQRKDKRPMLSDLRESGALEQDADLVIFIHREDMFQKKGQSSRQGIAEILLTKHRNGETGIVELAFISENARFENLAVGY